MIHFDDVIVRSRMVVLLDTPPTQCYSPLHLQAPIKNDSSWLIGWWVIRRRPLPMTSSVFVWLISIITCVGCLSFFNSIGHVTYCCRYSLPVCYDSSPPLPPHYEVLNDSFKWLIVINCVQWLSFEPEVTNRPPERPHLTRASRTVDPTWPHVTPKNNDLTWPHGWSRDDYDPLLPPLLPEPPTLVTSLPPFDESF